MDKNAALKTEIDSVSYSLGVNIGNNLKGQGFGDINIAAMMKAMEDVMGDKKLSIGEEEANGIIQNYFASMMEKKAKEGRKAGEAFLAENAKKAGVTTTASGLQYEVLKMGEGPKPVATDKVTVHYHGTLTDGKVFDSSVDRGEPATFPLNGVITGWTEALQLMPVGSKFRIYLPSDLAYGERGAGQLIGPHATLIFEVELLSIDK
ncbi:MAG: FKBP-type peptidyl-prolyl cis-trans isomerase [Sphingobacteriaceae bacterium]|nr:FKBP-type peptidyl-prolyl cis-trans isomerase [Sphingobacteriaceae bacterium]